MATDTKKWYWGTGRRKTSVARVRLCSGTGKVLVNDKPVDQYFTETENRNQVFRPLEVAELLGKMDVFVNVRGGGYNGQAGAVMQGLARAVKVMIEGAAPAPAAPAPTAEGEAPPAPAAPAEVKRMRDAGLLTRDARMKERKKYGRRGARRSFQFSKR
jgi:small subunit ribosomal protein S9